MAPRLVRFAVHAERRCLEYGRSRQEVVDIVLAHHQSRRRNPGSADWLVTGESLAVVYNWPDRGDATAAFVVSLWPQR